MTLALVHLSDAGSVAVFVAVLIAGVVIALQRVGLIRSKSDQTDRALDAISREADAARGELEVAHQREERLQSEIAAARDLLADTQRRLAIAETKSDLTPILEKQAELLELMRERDEASNERHDRIAQSLDANSTALLAVQRIVSRMADLLELEENGHAAPRPRRRATG